MPKYLFELNYSTEGIKGHGDVSNPFTWWLSHCAAWQSE